MAVYHKKFRNTGLNVLGKSYTVDGEGKLTPGPDEAACEFLASLPNYEVRPDAKAKPKAEKPKAEPKAEPSADEILAEVAEAAEEAPPKPKRTRRKRKPAAKKKAE